MRAPRLIGVLIDLPEPALVELAHLWHCEPAPRALYAAMTAPSRLAEAVAALPPWCGQVLRGLVEEPLRVDDLLGRVAIGRETVERALVELGRLGLVVRVTAGGRAQPLGADTARGRLAVAREIAGALAAASVR